MTCKEGRPASSPCDVTCASIDQGEQTIEATLPSIEMTLQSIEMTWPSIEMTLQSIEMTWPSIEITRPSIEMTWASIEMTLQSIEMTWASIEMTWASIEMTWASIEMTWQPIETTRPSIEKTLQSIETKEPAIEVKEQSIEAKEPAIEEKKQSIEAKEPPIEIACSPASIASFFASIACQVPSIACPPVHEEAAPRAGSSSLWSRAGPLARVGSEGGSGRAPPRHAVCAVLPQRSRASEASRGGARPIVLEPLYYCTTLSQNPLMHCSPVPQQSAAVVHFSSMFEQPIGTPQLPLLHAPPQQSMPVVHDWPLLLHGESVANARMLPLASS
jgi:hypothetical protein